MQSLERLHGEHNSCSLFMYASTHLLMVFLAAVPTVLVVGSLGAGLSFLPWTNQTCIDHKLANGLCSYYSPLVILVFDDILRSILLLGVVWLMVSVLFNQYNVMKYVLVGMCIPTFLLGLLYFITLYVLEVNIWFFFLDVVGFELVVVSGLTLAAALICRRNQTISKQEVLKFFFLPVILTAIAVGFVDAFFDKIYQLQEYRIKLVLRLFVYTVAVDVICGTGEFLFRKSTFATPLAQSHPVYLFQIAFGILGRYLVFTCGSLLYTAVLAFALAVKDIMLHRMSRAQCWFVYAIRRRCMPGQRDYGSFEEWFYNPEFQKFRAAILNSEFLHEFSGAFITPALIIAFKRHRLLFNFDYETLAPAGELRYLYLFEQCAVQLMSLIVSTIVIVMIEVRYNKLELTKTLQERTATMKVSQVVDYIWALLLILSTVRQMPNVLECNGLSPCDCPFGDYRYYCKNISIAG